MIPQAKVTVTHGGTSTDYTPGPFTSFTVKRRESNYDTAVLTFSDPDSFYYEDNINRFDEVKIYLKDAAESAYTQVFGGWARQANPRLNTQGLLPQLVCKGYAMALEEMHCNRDYGLESSRTSYHHIADILTDIVHWCGEHSFGGAASGWTIDQTFISTFCVDDVKYINNPYRTDIEAIDIVCQLSSAIGAGATAGGHWIVDHSKQFLFGKIGDHAAGASSPEASWPDWWSTNQTGSTLTQGIDFTEYQVIDKTEEFANHVILVTDFRRPTYDYWTEENSGGGGHNLWTNVNLASVTSDPLKIVGADSLKLLTESGAGAPGGYAYMDSPAAWDVTKWGSAKTIPRINFYIYKTDKVAEALSSVRLYTTDYNNDYYECLFSTWTENDAEWISKSIPIGPYYMSAEESKQFRWVKGDGGAPGGAADWTDINGIAFMVFRNNGDAAALYIDDLHFSGKIIRSAINTAGELFVGEGDYSVDGVNEYQKVLIARNAMDDSCVASDDSGFAARIAYAELLRRSKMPQTFMFSTTTDMKTAMAGQKAHLRLCKKPNGSYRIDDDVRMPEIQIDWSMQGVAYTVTATTDLTNSFPISLPDQYAMWMENMFVNSAEAKNIRSGAEVDLLIAMLQWDY